MTVSEFRKMALSFPEAVEGSHMDHPDFRVGGKSSPRWVTSMRVGAW